MGLACSVYWEFQTPLRLNTWLTKKEKSIIIIISIKKLCSFILSWIFRIISQRKALFIVTLQLVIFWLAVITELKCQTLGWWDRSTKTCTVERIRRSFLWNGWPQNQLMTAFTPSRVTCKSIVLCDGKTFSLTLRRTYRLRARLRWGTGENWSTSAPEIKRQSRVTRKWLSHSLNLFTRLLPAGSF